MLLCGLKLTHDGGIAVIDGNDLLFSIEMEKLDDSPRFQPLNRLEAVEEILAREGIRPGDIDRFVVDGWFAAPGESRPLLRVTHTGRPVTVEVAPYCEPDTAPRPDPLRRYTFDGLPLGPCTVPYSSYHHAAQHLLGAYCTSPYAAREEPALVLVWDGGMVPRLYRVEPAPLRVTSLGPLFPVYGSAFADFAAQFEPFRRTGVQDRPVDGHASPRHLDVAGKAMAYAALGQDEPDFYPVFDAELARLPLSFDTATELGLRIGRDRARLWPGSSDADLIASFQGYLGDRLLAALRARTAEATGGPAPNLCLAGGCALNIKWNSAVRSSGLFADVWIPPFPNDSGAALGTAVAEMVHHGGTRLRWSVHRGPDVVPTAELSGWRSRPCGAAELAKVLHESGEPVVVLHGRAELGPRALGGRSILAPATDLKTRDVLNDIKDREFYRPVAPVCLESRAPEIFSPGCPDPYMLFDHAVRPGWADRIPAVVHLDGTARLQTVSPGDNAFLAEVLTAYEELSGIPVLCNTSANRKGRGFFPSVEAAARWDRVDSIWCDGLLHTRRP
ncbi:carbamoyltransferase N-terminal domain-containing protein [Streptomyces sp. AK02-01A]|uniref:carbamoyltransferase N-terminal domain-containing protein n=1 Tax=Streptomyces sp. AK02-01A TaxID=3028648 RepID=UPI0029AC81F5|nr:carbamoyltransferase N-terminal domain-containing protein [Streptomyces sp. AK02-01A]MDX3852393.1 carbamoyltransferase N-terminal domain-containing protein [Streptomyces sp. AK02-01A]